MFEKLTSILSFSTKLMKDGERLVASASFFDGHVFGNPEIFQPLSITGMFLFFFSSF
jgi:hypothetical protein